MVRIATGVVLAVILAAALIPENPWVFVGLALIAITLIVSESYRILGAGSARPLGWIGLPACWALVATFVEPRFVGAAVGVLAVTTMLTLMAVMLQDEEPPVMLNSALATLFPVLFAGLAVAFLVGLRCLPDGLGRGPLVLGFVAAFAGDIAAYYFGRAFGRRRMAPRLSPKKSWEGALAGVLASSLSAWVVARWLIPELPGLHAWGLGLVLGVVGIFGDLSASLLKRAVGVKDASRLLPGHGGLLDRTDSLMFAGPILYYYSLYFLRGS